MEPTTQHTGKRAEFFVFGELVRRGADVYLPIIDIGIDAIVRRQDGTHLDIQVKSTEKEWSPTAWVPDDPELRQRRFIVWVDMSEPEENLEIWVFRGDIFYSYSTKIGAWQNGTYRRLVLDETRRGDDHPRRDLLKKYRGAGAWELLTSDTYQGKA